MVVKYLVAVEECEDTETEWFDQLIDALDNAGIVSTVHELEPSQIIFEEKDNGV